MTLIQALQQMQPDDRLRREAWGAEDGYWIFESTKSLTATDWEIVHTYTPDEIEALRMAMLEAANKAMCHSLSPTYSQLQSVWLAAQKAYNKAKESTL